MTQNPRESMCIYFARNVETFKMFMSSKSDDMPQAVGADNEQKNFWKDAEVTLGQFFQTQLFNAGLHDQSRRNS
jgi:hypothetical protein